MLKSILASLLVASASASFADTIVFKNGDKLTGTVASKSDTEIVLKVAFGEIKVPADAVASVLSDAEFQKKVEEVAKGAVAEAKAEPAPAAKAEAAAAEAKADASFEDDFESWLDAYRKFVHENVPEGWEFKISGAIERRKTASSTNAYGLAFEAKKKWGESDEFYAKAYYDYASEKNSMGIEDTTTDKYGAVTNYKHYFNESPWYLTNTLSYEVDRIKGIRDQVDEILGVGRQFKFFDDTLVINLSLGPSIRYVNADAYDQHFVPMGTVLQDLTWQLHKYARFEEAFFAGISLTNKNEYNYNVNLGLVFRLTDVLDIALRYYYSYDKVNASSAQKSEERLMLSFEIPLK